MSQGQQEHIEVEPFDREYRLEELLPQKQLASISAPWSALLPEQWAIYTEKGSMHHSARSWSPQAAELLTTTFGQAAPDQNVTIGGPHGVRLVLFPMDYELEIKGYLVIDATEREQDALDLLGQASVSLLQQLMRLNHKTLLTSGLHGAVVAESYTQLKEKAAQLACSEEKYRTLAANLEIEVQKKAKEIRLAHARLMNQDKMAAIGQLSAGMAHEINNPLGFILSNLDTLKGYALDLAELIEEYRQLFRSCTDNQGAPGPDALMDHCRSIEALEDELDGAFLLADIPTLTEESISGARRIQKIVSDLKIVARPGESGPEPINIHTSIDAVLTILQNRIGSRIELRRRFEPVALVSGHPQEINQVWLNLILNALESMNDGGTLGIKTRTVDGHVMVIISDTGTGIPQTEQGKIFEPFFTTKEIGQGTGLGLHLAYQVVAKHGGRIDVESSPGRGSRFTVHLPVAGRK